MSSHVIELFIHYNYFMCQICGIGIVSESIRFHTLIYTACGIILHKFVERMSYKQKQGERILEKEKAYFPAD